ncbi:MAG: hypothetical protein VX527_01870 [Planctomycetota bacterium]|nr:hypothetical protein [Planctomycetota bacterium]
MWIRYALVLSLCLFGFACEKKDDGSGSSGSTGKDGQGKITINEGGKSQPGTATVMDADPKQQKGVVSTPGDKKTDDKK